VTEVDRLLEEALEQEDAHAAIALLEKAHRIDPNDPDVLYELGLAKEEVGDREGMIAAFLEVSRLDPLEDDRASLLDDGARDRIAAFAEVALARVPRTFLERLGNVAIVIEDYPPRHAVEEGLDPRSFGMFEGPDDLAQHSSIEIVTTPTRIVLFGANLMAAFEGDDLEDEVTITVLHEIGHYFGLDEEEVAALGLA
jgi:predicted Zn-dependent protease with MMP-like domain